MVASLVVCMCVCVWLPHSKVALPSPSAALLAMAGHAAFQGLRLANHAVERRLTNCALGTAACGNSEASSSAVSMRNFVRILTHRQVRSTGAAPLNCRHLHMEPQARRSTPDARRPATPGCGMKSYALNEGDKLQIKLFCILHT